MSQLLHDEPAPSERLDRMRRRFCYAISLIGIPLALFFSFVNYERGLHAIVAGDIVFVVLLSVNLVLLRARRSLVAPVVIAAAALVFFLLMAMSTRIVQAYLWAYLVPGIVFFAIGLRRGVVLNGAFAVVLTAIVLIAPPDKLSSYVQVSILASFGFVSVLAYLYERLRRDYELELHKLSTTDVLTGIANRRRFEEQLRSEVSRAHRYQHPLSLVVFDIDHFKGINDRLGHAAGDRVIAEVGRIAASCVRQTDLVARLGGDEFVVILPETPAGEGTGEPSGAWRVAERIRRAVAAEDFGLELPVAVTLGIAGTQPDETPDSLFLRADKALYAAKRAGRNRTAVG